MDCDVEWTSDLTGAGTYDCKIELLSLPFVFGTRIETIPANVPYLLPDAGKIAAWSKAIGRHGLKVGLAWQGSSGRFKDDTRSLPLAGFRDLSRTPGARLISLQGINGLEALKTLPDDMTIERLGDRIEANPDGIAEIAAVM